MTSRLSRARFSAAIAVAFFCGLIFASGFDLTHFSWAQGRVGSSTNGASKPTASQVAPAVDLESAFEAVADHARPAVVSIDIEKFAKPKAGVTRRVSPRGQGGQLPPGMEQFFRQFEGRDAQPDDTPEEASGSGFIVSEDGYILTNNHVVADADRVNVTLFDKRVFPAKVIGRDSTTDVAVIKIDAGTLPTISLGDDSKARVGQWVLAIGNPLTLDFTVTAGIVSAKGRKATGLLNPNGQNPYAITDYIQTDAAINPGNSGGPLLNIRGEVIGINSAIASGTGRYEGYGFAIPITLAKQVMDDLVKYGKVRRAVVGVVLGEVSPADAKAARLTQVGGALVGDFNPPKDSPAEKAGIQIGDVIVSADSKPVDQVSTLQRIIRGHKPGDVVDLEVMRYGEKKDFKVKLAEPPTDTKVAADDPENSAPVRPTASTGRANDKLGITVDAIPQDFLQESRLQQQYRSGLYVSSVSGRGPAFRGLFQSDIILKEMAPSQRDIHTADDLQAAVAPLKSGDVVQFKVCANPDARTGSCPTRIVSIQIQ